MQKRNGNIICIPFQKQTAKILNSFYKKYYCKDFILNSHDIRSYCRGIDLSYVIL